MGVDLDRPFDGLLDRFAGFAGQAQDERAVDLDAQLVAILGEFLGDFDQHAFFDVVQDLLVAALVADEQQAEAVILEDFQGFARHVGFGVAGPGDAEFAELAGDGFGAGQVVGEGVVVEEPFAGLREEFHTLADFGGDVFGAADAVFVAADGLRPEAEGAAGFAAAAGVHRDVGVHQVADEVVLDAEVAFVDFGDEGELVHVFQHGALLVVDDFVVGIAVGDAVDGGPGAVFGDFLDGEVEFIAGDEVDGGAALEGFGGLDGDLGADHADFEAGFGVFEGGGDFDVAGEAGGAGVHDDEVVLFGLVDDGVHAEARGWGVDEFGAFDEGGGLG